MDGYGGMVTYTYVYDKVLSANQSLPADGIRTDQDSDFYLLGMLLEPDACTSMLFSLQLKDASGNYFQSKPTLAENIRAQSPMGYTFQGDPRIFPPGSQLTVGPKELSGAENTIQILFIGLKRFVVPPPVCGPEPMSSRLVMR